MAGGNSKSNRRRFGGRTAQNPNGFRKPFSNLNPPVISNRTPSDGDSTASELQKTETQKAPIQGAAGLISTSDINKTESSNGQSLYKPTRAEEGADGKYAAEPPKGALGADDSLIQKGKSLINKSKSFMSNHKKGFAGGLIGVVMGGGLIGFGTLLSGPMQFMHLAELIGEIANTIHDISIGARSARTLNNIRQGFQTGAKFQNSRLNLVAQFWSNSYEAKLKKGGVTINADKYSGIFDNFEINFKNAGYSKDGFLRYGKETGTFDDTGRMIYELKGHPDFTDGTKFVNVDSGTVRIRAPDGLTGVARSRWFQKTAKTISRVAKNIPKVGAIGARTLARKNAMLTFQVFDRIAAKTGGTVMKKISQWVESKVEKRFLKQAGTASIAVKVAEKATTKISAKVIGTAVLKTALSLIDLTPVGWIISAVMFGVTLALREYAEEALISMTLGVSMADANEIRTIASQIKAGDFEGGDLSSLFFDTAYAEDGDETYMIPLEQLELASQEYLYREVDTVNITKEQAKQIEESGIGNILETGEVNGKIGSSVWQNSLIQYEADGKMPAKIQTDMAAPLMDIHYGTKDSWQNTLNNIAASAVEAMPFNPVGISWDTFSKDEQYIGSGSSLPNVGGAGLMYGARVLEKESNRQIGATEKSGLAAQQIERERRETIAAEFNARTWYDKLFDTSTYHSAIATLAREANWDLNDTSIFNQLKNVAQTFLAAPQLIANNFNRNTTTAMALSNGYDYGFGKMAYSASELEALDAVGTFDAENYVQGQLKERRDNTKKEIEKLLNPSLGNIFSLFGSKNASRLTLFLTVLQGLKNSCGQAGTGCFLIENEEDGTFTVHLSEEAMDNLVKECKKTFACGLYYLNINFPYLGITINADGDVVPLSNKEASYDTQSPYYNYQESNTTCRFTDKAIDVFGPERYWWCRPLNSKYQAYLMDYQIITTQAALMHDGSEESEAAFGSNKAETESALSSLFYNLIGSYSGGL